jgi:limonene-1,2-epoxide hydrolase
LHYAIIFNENSDLVDKVVIETEPVFVEFEIIAFQINIHSLAYRLSHVYDQVVLLERLDYGVIGLLRVEISVCVYILEKLDTVVMGEEI